ncbi:tyrosinase-like protein tyr-3-like 2 [Homarus americanus]|uniref:Tyrosinase-like protein tyr-3-like 2 n=1 Tax=Homarus americanus TaxID=6706 RepID=A0A8J5JI12_HOMAM|nr:tyrosinase-like protein tyr-3-like 2 [Homarus americanus]
MILKDILKIQKLYNCANTTGVSVVTERPITRPQPETCADNNKYCDTWEKIGECKKNPTWMHVNCKKSCRQCGVECSDNSEHCKYWAKNGECAQNPSYMSRFCKKSCGVCHASADFISDECRDHNTHCKEWGKKLQCRANPNYMLIWCRKTCGHCQ